MPPSKPLQSVLNKVDQVTDYDGTDLLSVMRAFGDRAFGPVLTLCGIILLTPLGAVPGAPLALFIIMASFTLQILFDRDHPWVPHILHRVKISRKRVVETKNMMRPWLKRIDGFLRPRWPWAVRPFARKVGAFLILLVSATLLPLGLVPFAAMVPGIIIVILGLGITARDGLFITMGFAISAAYLTLLPLIIILQA